jgi:1-phosphofructokinase family hexose kinase
MIVTVTLNPSYDRTLGVAALVPGAIHRARVVREDAGGKGVNVSRALSLLGIESEVLGFFGGRTGRALVDALTTSGHRVHAIAVEGEARQNLTLCDDATGEVTKINEPGPTVDRHAITELWRRVDACLEPGDLWVLSGSLPPGAPTELYADLCDRIAQKGAVAFVDASGAVLSSAVAARPHLVKPNTDEASDLVGRRLSGDEDHGRAALELAGRGIARVVLTRGADGLVLASAGELVLTTPPSVAIKSPIGAGDAALAGLLWAELDGVSPSEMARRATACGTAAAMQEGTGVGQRELVLEILAKVTVRTLHGASTRH